MWIATARVERSRVISAGLEEATAFLLTAGAWALQPGVRYALTVPDSPPGLGRLICLVGAPPGGSTGSILEVTDQESGQLIRVRSRSTNPVGKQVVTLSASPHRRGVRATLDVRVICDRHAKAFVESDWRKSAGSWLSAIADVLEGRSPWPAPDMPADLQRDWQQGSALASHELMPVEGVVRAAPRAAWQTIRSPATQRSLMPPLYAGYVPGTPQGQVGEMAYQVLPLEDHLIAGIYLIVELAEEQWVRTARIGRPRTETLTRLKPAGDGTKITLTARVPGDSGREVLEQVPAILRARMDAYQELLGQPA